MALGDVYRLRTCVTCQQQNGINITHWQVTQQDGAGASAGQIAAALENLLAPLYKAALPVGASWYGVDVQRILPAPAQVAFPRITLTGAGLLTGGVLPGQNAALVRFSTGVAKRTGRGRLYFPFIPSLQISAIGTLLAAYETLVSTVGAAYVNPIIVAAGPNQSTLQLCLLNRKTNITSLVQTGNTSQNVWSQRRREFGRRPDILPF